MRKYNIMVLHAMSPGKNRKTIRDSLFCFKRYVPEHNFFYFNWSFLNVKFINNFITHVPFDAVIFHYNFLGRRYSPADWEIFFLKFRKILANLQGIKILIPQDEYDYTQQLRDLIRECGVNHVFTCANEKDWNILYPLDEIGTVGHSMVYTGYIDEETVKKIDKIKHIERDIDIGYRAGKLPYWQGRHAQLKYLLVEKFNEALLAFPHYNTDIRSTLFNKNTFMENDWIHFLLRCRTMPGCLGGSGLMHTDGKIINRVNKYCKEHPEADFDEVERECFPGEDGKINLFALSPRHFECAMTKTCQILIEGDYYGVFLPGVHYIEIKKDFSNLLDVLKKIEDKEYCEKIAQRCYDDIVKPVSKENKNTYSWFANHVVEHIKKYRSQLLLDNKKTNNFFIFYLFMYHILNIPKKIILFLYMCIKIPYKGIHLLYLRFPQSFPLKQIRNLKHKILKEDIL